MRVRDARDAGLVDDGRREAGDVLGDEDALLEPAVGQLQAGDDVADGVHALDVGAAALVGEHEPALHRDALLLVAQAVGRRPATDRDEQQLGLDHVAALDGHGDAVVGGLHGLERRAGARDDAALAERAFERLRRRLLLAGDEPGECLDDRDVGSERAPHAGELAPDDAATQHHDRRRDPVEPQGVLGGDDPLAVDVETGQRPRRTSRTRARRAGRSTTCRRRSPGAARSAAPRPR